MIQALLGLLQMLATGLFGIAALVLAVSALVRWRRKHKPVVITILAVVFGSVAALIWSVDLFTAETTDREEAAQAFYANFDFYPPSSVRDIKAKNIAIYDAVGHYMAFTYEDWVFADVLAHDGPLDTAYANSPAFDAIVNDHYQKDHNRPDWAVLPTGRTNMILYKKNFMRHSYSDYYLWVDSVAQMVHLRVSYFD